MHPRIRFYLLYLLGIISVTLQQMLHLGKQNGGSPKRTTLADFCSRQGFIFLSSRLRYRFEAKLHQLLRALQSSPDGRPLHRSSLYAVRYSGDHEEYVFHQNYAHCSGGKVKHVSGYYCNCPLRGYPEMLLISRSNGSSPRKHSLKALRWHLAASSRSFRLYLRGEAKVDPSHSRLLNRIEELCPAKYSILAGQGLLVVNQQVKDTPDSSFEYQELLDTARSIARQFQL